MKSDYVVARRITWPGVVQRDQSLDLRREGQLDLGITTGHGRSGRLAPIGRRDDSARGTHEGPRADPGFDPARVRDLLIGKGDGVTV